MGDWDHSVNSSAGIYHYNTNNDQIFLGVENKFKNKGLTLGVFSGVTNTSNANPALLLDLKESYKYDSRGIFSNNVRVRNTLSDGTNTTQIRVSPLTVSVPVSKTTTVYANPHYVGKYNYNTKEWTQGAGIFAGVEQKLGNTTIAFEGQRYNIQDWNTNKGNWGVNVIFTQTF